MAGAKDSNFKELISPFLKRRMGEIEAQFGSSSLELAALTMQYVKDPREDIIESNQRRRHYESEVEIIFKGEKVKGVERLYKKTILLEPTTVCAAHCRWCLRGQYPVSTLKKKDITLATEYMGSEVLRRDINEVLITGGDPLMALPLLGFTLSELDNNCPNIKIVRIGSRVPFQDPERVNDSMLDLFRRYPNFVFEIGVNVNHPVEFCPETEEAISKLHNVGVSMYNQHPLLKGVNDDLDALIQLYILLRRNNIEAHYLFHAIPMRGMDHHRTTIDKGLSLVSRLSSCGQISGRAKPKFAVMSDIGKIVLYEGTILARNEQSGLVLLQSNYKLADRLKYCPGWAVPDSVEIGNGGCMQTWYQDAVDSESLDSQKDRYDSKLASAEE